MYVAKLTTKYPEFKGAGYYNFIMDEDEGSLDALVEEQLHDFNYVGTEYVDMTQHEMLNKYPTKEDMNKEVFNA